MIDQPNRGTACAGLSIPSNRIGVQLFVLFQLFFRKMFSRCEMPRNVIGQFGLENSDIYAQSVSWRTLFRS